MFNSPECHPQMASPPGNTVLLLPPEPQEGCVCFLALCVVMSRCPQCPLHSRYHCSSLPPRHRCRDRRTGKPSNLPRATQKWHRQDLNPVVLPLLALERDSEMYCHELLALGLRPGRASSDWMLFPQGSAWLALSGHSGPNVTSSRKPSWPPSIKNVTPSTPHSSSPLSYFPCSLSLSESFCLVVFLAACLPPSQPLEDQKPCLS